MASAQAPAPTTGETARAGVARRPEWVRSLDITIPAVMLVLILGACFVWPLIGPVPRPVGGSVMEANLPPFTNGHLLGTNQVGNDIWARLLHGGRASLEVAFAVTAVGFFGGGALGALGGYVGGVLDPVIMRILDMMIAFPAIVLALAITQTLGPSQFNTTVAICFFSIPAFARVARAATLQLREQPFMMAAKLSGTKNWRVLVRHIAPNIVPQLVTFALLGMGIIIIVAGALSFLGLGIPPPHPSWGNMISAGQNTMSAYPRLVLIPSAMLFVTVLSFNLLGEALRARWSQQ